MLNLCELSQAFNPICYCGVKSLRHSGVQNVLQQHRYILMPLLHSINVQA